MRMARRSLPAPTEDRPSLQTKVDNPSVRDGQSGKSGARIVADYRGIPVLSVYAPLDFDGQPFVLLAEIDKAEVLGEMKPAIVVADRCLSGLVAGLLVLGSTDLCGQRAADMRSSPPAERVRAFSRRCGCGDTVEDRLHGDGREEHAEHAHHHLARREPDQMVDLLGKQQKDQRDEHHCEDRKHHGNEQLRVALRLRPARWPRSWRLARQAAASPAETR